MRDIKFRAWVQPLGVMARVRWMAFDAGECELYNPHDPDSDDFWYYPFIYLDIEQFTGLKDKNGVEIYEGDIVADEGGVAGTVEYFDSLTWEGGCVHPGYYCSRWFNSAPSKELCWDDDFQDCRIIGNIHENPELMEDGNANP